MNEPKASLNGNQIHIQAIGKSWLLTQQGKLEDLWDAMGEDGLDRIPYWIELWPASLTLAEWLFGQRNKISEQICIDLGCGMGFTALAGSYCGAKVVAVDYEWQALASGVKNARLNKVAQPLWAVMDWSAPAIKQNSVKYLWAADISYETRFQAPIFNFARHVLQDEGYFWLAEPGRAIFYKFLDYARENGWNYSPVFQQSVPPLRDEHTKIKVTVWQFSKIRSSKKIFFERNIY